MRSLTCRDLCRRRVNNKCGSPSSKTTQHAIVGGSHLKADTNFNGGTLKPIFILHFLRFLFEQQTVKKNYKAASVAQEPEIQVIWRRFENCSSITPSLLAGKLDNQDTAAASKQDSVGQINGYELISLRPRQKASPVRPEWP